MATIPRRQLLAVVLAFVVALTGCTSSARSAHETEPAAVQSTDPTSLKGASLARAQTVLEGEGWTVTALATKKRSIKAGDGDHWQVVKVAVGEDHTVRLTVGKLTTKVEKLPFKTRTKKLSSTRIGVTKVVQKGVSGRRVITFLDGKKISSKMTRKPVTKVIGIGTWRPYTGSCTILGTYAHRYVSCAGYYDPAAKRRAKSLANLCNSTTSPVAACRGVYGRTYS